MERMNEEEFINNIEEHIASLKNLDNKALKILVGKLEEENKNLKETIKRLEFDVDAWYQLKLLLEGEIEKLKEELRHREEGDYYYDYFDDED